MKENTNVYFQARKEAATWDSRLFNRDFAAEQLGIASYTLGEYERGVTKVVPIDKVVLMADLYNKPELVTNYCRHECPVHGFLPYDLCQIWNQGRPQQLHHNEQRRGSRFPGSWEENQETI